MAQGADGKGEKKSGGNLTDFSLHEKRKSDMADGSTVWEQQYASSRLQEELVGFSETGQRERVQ